MWKLVILLVSVNLFSSAYGETIKNLYNTGVNSVGNALQEGSLEEHYYLSSNVSVSNVIAISEVQGHWIKAPTGSSWIGVASSSSNTPVGNYSYSITFDLTGLNYETARISGKWATDNSAVIYLNNVNTGITNGNTGFDGLYSFSITDGFVSGTNTLTFTVNNASTTGTFNPSGLLVFDLYGTADIETVDSGDGTATDNETSCKDTETGTVSSNLDIHMPSLNYTTLFETQNIWADLEYLGTNADGIHTWGLKNYGVNLNSLHEVNKN